MFRCQMCGHVTSAKVKSERITVATREKLYAPRGKDPAASRFRPRGPFDKGGVGQEIVRELMACPQCVSAHQASEAVAE